MLLNLAETSIGGVIPSSISNSSNLMDLFLNDNKFSGQIPNSLGDLRHLEYLELFNNNLSFPHLSIFASLVNCRKLISLWLAGNPLNVVLPDSVGNLSGYDNISDKYSAYIAAVSNHIEPKSYIEAAKDPRWIEAMKSEIEALQSNRKDSNRLQVDIQSQI